MRDLLPALLPQLEGHRIEGLDAGPKAFYPSYEGYSLVNLPASVCRWLGVPLMGSAPLGPEIMNLWQREFQQIVFLLVDGLGLDRVEAVLSATGSDAASADWQSITQDAVLAPLTSIVPSTTAAALTTLWTGTPPSEHGVLAYEVWLKEYGLIANMILHAPASYTGDPGSLLKAGFNPETFLPVPTLGPHLRKHGVHPYAFQHHSIAYSGLSRMLFPGVDIMPFRTLSDLWVTLSSVLDSPVVERRYLYVYWSELDEMMHRFGPEDERTRLEQANFSRQLALFLQKRRAVGRGDTLVIVTADHGHNSTPSNPNYAVQNHPRLLDCLVMPPSGEARLPVVYLRPGKEAEFRRYVEQAWPGIFQILPSDQAVRAGLFGERVYDRFHERVGDLVLVPQVDEAYWWFSARENHLLGRHGGMSRTEMLTPFLALAL
jgi:hypothetical protein